MEDEKNDHSEKENILILLGDYVAVRNFSNTDAGKLFHTICRYALNSFHPVSNQLPLKCFESYKSYFAAKNILTI